MRACSAHFSSHLPHTSLSTFSTKVKLKDAGLCSLQVVTGQAQPAVRKLVGRLRNIPLPPEVLQGQRPRRAADVWAFGHLMWELCTGERGRCRGRGGA